MTENQFENLNLCRIRYLNGLLVVELEINYIVIIDFYEEERKPGVQNVNPQLKISNKTQTNMLFLKGNLFVRNNLS